MVPALLTAVARTVKGRPALCTKLPDRAVLRGAAVLVSERVVPAVLLVASVTEKLAKLAGRIAKLSVLQPVMVAVPVSG